MNTYEYFLKETGLTREEASDFLNMKIKRYAEELKTEGYEEREKRIMKDICKEAKEWKKC